MTRTAWGHALLTLTDGGTVLDAWFPSPALGAPGAADGWLRLHLLSHRLVVPNSVSLDGLFGVLTNVVWTSQGPCAVEGFELTRVRMLARGTVQVFGVDKFPRMT